MRRDGEAERAGSSSQCRRTEVQLLMWLLADIRAGRGGGGGGARTGESDFGQWNERIDD